MAEPCKNGPPEELLSGYLDGALTQGEEQRIRLHLEDCRPCRQLFKDLSTLREATMSTDFEVPRDDQFREAPRGGLSRLSFSLGWLLIGIWVLAFGVFFLWQLLTSPDGLIEKLMIFGLFSGIGLLVLSVLLDRIRTYKTDRYRGVEK